MEFFKNLSTELIMVVVCVLVVLFILGKLAKSLIKRILIGAVAGCIVSAVLYYIFHLPIKTVGLIGIIVFLGGAIFGKVDWPKLLQFLGSVWGVLPQYVIFDRLKCQEGYSISAEKVL